MKPRISYGPTRVPTDRGTIEAEYRGVAGAAPIPASSTWFAASGFRELEAVLAAIRRDQLEVWKVLAVAPRVAGQQREPFQCRVRADVEVGQRRALHTTATTIATVGLAGDEGSFPWQRQPRKGISGKGLFERFDGLVVNGELGVDDRVERQTVARSPPGRASPPTTRTTWRPRWPRREGRWCPRGRACSLSPRRASAPSTRRCSA